MTSPDSIAPDSHPYARWIFLAGLVLFLIFQVGLVMEVQLTRVLPPEAKDAYRYIFNAVELRHGFNYNTPALNDFRTLTAPEPGDSIARYNLKWVEYHSLFFTHYVVHSAFLLLISGIFGVSLGTAYKITAILGSFLIAGAISYFLLTITDRISAGLALASMALTLFPVQGIHYVVPTNICLALGLILLSIVLRTDGKIKWTLFVFSIILIYLHRMGIIYVCLCMFTIMILRYKIASKKQIFFQLFPTLVIVGISTFIIFIFPLPFFRIGHLEAPPGTNYFHEVLFNSFDLLKLYGNWFLDHGVVYVPKPIYRLISSSWISFIGYYVIGFSLLIFPLFLRKERFVKHPNVRWLICWFGAMMLLPILSALVLIIIVRTGLLYPPEEKKYPFYLCFILFFLLLFPSVLQVMYITEWKHAMVRADLTNRLWVPFAVVLAAIFGRGLYLIFQNIRQGSYDFLPSSLRNQGMVRNVLQPRYLWAVLVVFLVIGYAPRLAQAYLYRRTIMSFMIFRQNVVFDPGQLKLTLQNTKPRDIIVYDDDFIRHYFLSHGGLWRRALYVPLFPVPKNYTFKPDDIKYEISWNPYLWVFRYENERAIQDPLTISAGSTLTLTLEPDFKPEAIQILPGSSPEKASKLKIIRTDPSGKKNREDIRIKGRAWQTFPLSPGAGGTLAIINADPSEPFYLAGLRFGGQQTHHFLWPWHGVTQVSLDDKQLKLERSALLENTIKIKGILYSREVVQDKGSTVLWRLTPQKEGQSLQVPSPAGHSGSAQEPAASLLQPGNS